MNINRAYQAYYQNKTIEIQAENSYQAQLAAARVFGVQKAYKVAVVLSDVPLSTASLG